MEPTNCEVASDSSCEEGGYSRLRNEFGGDTYNTRISRDATIKNLHIGPEIFVESDQKQALTDLAINVKGYLQNYHKNVEDRLNSLPCMDELWREDYLQNQYVPLLIYEVKRDKKKNSPKDLPDLFKCSRRIFIEGEAGYGKSTLARKLAFDWAFEEQYLISQFDFVFYVELRCVGSVSIHEHIISDLEHEEQGDRNLLMELLKQHQTKTLFILDGLDELLPQERLSKLNKFQKVFAASTILVTTQPVINVESRQQYRRLYDCKFVVEGFSHENVDVFTNKMITSFIQNQSDGEDEVDEDRQLDMIRELKNFVKGSYYFHENLEKLLNSPLFLCLLCFLFVNKKEVEQELPQTVSDVYITIMKQLTDNYINKTLDIESNCNLKQKLREEIENGLRSFGKLALKSLIDDSVTFTEDQINTCHYSSHIKKIGFLQRNLCSNRRKGKGPVVYQPVHKTFLEYLAAFYISSLKDDYLNLNEAIEMCIHVPPLLYSKSAKTDGQRPSMLVTFVCGLLENEAYKFLRKLLSNEHNYFEQFLDICCLLQHCPLNNENIECVMEFRVKKKWDLRWLFGRGYDNTPKFLRILNISCKILCLILEHPKCPIIKYELSHIDLMHIDKAKEDFTSVLKSLQQNNSVKSVSILKHHESPNDFAQDVCLPVYQKVTKTIVRMKNLEKIKIDTDIFIENASLSFTCLKELFAEIKHANHLQALILTATHISDEILCEDFHDKKSRNRQAKKKHAREKIVDDELLGLLAESLKDNAGLSKLSLPKMCISYSAVDKLVELLATQRIQALRIPELQLCLTEGTKDMLSDVIAPIFRSLSIHTCLLEELDTRHFVFDKSHASCLAEHLKVNRTLKTLNLVGCLKSFEIARPVLEALLVNLTLERINVSSSNFVVESDDEAKFVVQALCPSLSKPARNLKCVSLSGWKFLVERPETLNFMAKAINTSTLIELCVRYTQCKILVPLGLDFTKLAETATHFLQQCLSLRFLDLRNAEACLVPYTDPFCRTDSGFHSLNSLDEELYENSSEDSPQVSFSDDSETLDFNADCSNLTSELKRSVLFTCDAVKTTTVTANELYGLMKKSGVGKVQVCFSDKDFFDYKHSTKLRYD